MLMLCAQDIKVRSEKHAAIIRDEWREAEKGIETQAADTLI